MTPHTSSGSSPAIAWNGQLRSRSRPGPSRSGSKPWRSRISAARVSARSAPSRPPLTGGLLLIATVVPALEVVTTTALVSGTPVEQAVVITYRLSGVTVLLSFLAVALAGAFAHGTRLRADTEGLV